MRRWAEVRQTLAKLRITGDPPLARRSRSIEGHTDNTGSDAHNQALSEKRAISVKTYWSPAGVNANRLTTQGTGASRPWPATTPDLGRSQNRRVEVVKKYSLPSLGRRPFLRCRLRFRSMLSGCGQWFHRTGAIVHTEGRLMENVF